MNNAPWLSRPYRQTPLQRRIPNIYHQLENKDIIWEEIIDSDNFVEYKLHCKESIKKGLRNYEGDHEFYDIEDIDISNVKFRFYVNQGDSEQEQSLEIVGNSDDSFTFQEKWKHVFCYGYEVPDFHSLDKNKLFTLNFSATQEIDRIQQEEVGKLADQVSRIDHCLTDVSNNSVIINSMKETISMLTKTTNNLSLKVINMERQMIDLQNAILKLQGE